VKSVTVVGYRGSLQGGFKMMRHFLCRCVPAALAVSFAACDDGGSAGPTDSGTDTDTDADGGADAGDACVETAAVHGGGR
jgi:hypothetical protein